MQPIENQSLALLSLCWQGCVSESENAFRQVLCGHPTLAGQESPKRTAPLNLHESLTHNVRLRLKQGQMGLLRLYPCGRYTVRCRFEPEPIPAKVCSNPIILARKVCRSFCVRSLFRGLTPFAVAPTVTATNPSRLSSDRRTRAGAFFRILLFACFVYFAVPPSPFTSQPSTSLTHACQSWT